jgi:prephenate dehydrogenase
MTPSPRARQATIDLVDAMVRQVGAKPYFIDPDEHDAYVAGVSHLPFLLSAALVELTAGSPGWKEMAPLAASGYRDISRLASGDPEMHRDICMTNRTAIIRWLDETARMLSETRDQIEAGQSDKLLELFERARDARERWLNSRPNLRPGEAEFENIAAASIDRPRMFGWLGRSSRDRKR